MAERVAARSDTIKLSTGVRLRYTEQGSASGEAVLFLHGYSDSAYSFSLIQPLLPARVRLIAPDQRGHGDSEQPAGGYAIGDFATDAVALLDALGIKRATVVGHSMGSLIAQRVAIDHGDRVACLVLIGTATTAMNDGVLGLRQQVHELTDPVPVAFVREFQMSTIHTPLPAAFVDHVVSESCKLPARVWQAVIDGILAFDSSAELPTLRCPTLIVWGEYDAIFGRSEQDRVRDAIPDAKLLVYPDTGHDPHWERPAEFVRDLLAFVATRQTNR